MKTNEVKCKVCGTILDVDTANWQVKGHENDPICPKCESTILLLHKHVHVNRKPDDLFAYSFTGYAIGIRNGNLQVRDADDDVWEVDADQCAALED